MKKILLFSSGLDSYLAWHYLGKPMCAYFPIGHKYEKQELDAIEYFQNKEGMDCRVTPVFDFAELEEDNAFIPARNLYFLLYAANYGEQIYLVTQKGEESYKDTKADFFVMAQRMISYLLDRKVQIDSPFWSMTKQDSVKWYLDKGLPVLNLLKTWSCHHPVMIGEETYHCGECNACFRRWVSFEYNNICCDGLFATPPHEAKVVDEYITKLQSGQYDERRTQQTLDVLRRFGRL